MNEKNTRTKTQEPFAAGTYLVGDPCYAFSNYHPSDTSLWRQWLDSAWHEGDPNKMRILDGRVQGRRIAASVTAYGDGVYYDEKGHEYPVDAGLIGVVHESFLPFLSPTETAEGKTPFGMHLVTFAEPFHVEFNDGVIAIGDILIETGDDVEDGCEFCGEVDCAQECLEDED